MQIKPCAFGVCALSSFIRAGERIVEELARGEWKRTTVLEHPLGYRDLPIEEVLERVVHVLRDEFLSQERKRKGRVIIRSRCLHDEKDAMNGQRVHEP